MKRINIFFIFWIITGLILLIVSMHFRKQSDAIVAQVEPERTAISFQKPVKIKAIYVIPGQDVKQGELLTELERPDLLYDSDLVTNEMNSVMQEKLMFLDNINAQIELSKLESLSETKDIDEQINFLRAQQNQTRQIISSFETIDQNLKNPDQGQTNLTELKIQALINEKNQIVSIHGQKIRQLEDRRKNELDIYELKKERLQQEMDLLSQEKNYLLNYSPIDGTIGDVYAQVGELISPYQTIISIYEKHPKIIKAYMNEKNKYQVNVGEEVWVESSNRQYRIVGKVAEIGSRIISYPSRLLIDQNIKIWGQEIFIEIPPENMFLNGEKVYVRRK